MTVREFFDAWFRPVVLVGERGSAEPTIVSYSESVEWWDRITYGPGLLSIDEFTIAQFQDGLRKATFRRGPLAPERPLAAHTIAKHLKQIRAILHRTGPTIDQNRPTKSLLTQAPHLRVQQPRTKVKPHFAHAVVERIALAVADMTWGRHRGLQQPPPCPAPLWWWALLCLLYYTGLRIGTVLQLRWSMVEERDDGFWLNVPAAVVQKTHKGLEKYLRAEAYAALVELREALLAGGTGKERSASELLLPWPYCYGQLTERHELLQTLAGVPLAKQLSPHAWRRTFGTEMGRVGSKLGLQAARAALDHEDAETTSTFYVDLEPELIRKLPALVKRDDSQKRLF